MEKSALTGIKVVEIGTMVSAPYCGKLLGDLGADVVKVEPPSGDAARSSGPFAGNRQDPETSALFLYLNTSKRGIVLDLETRRDVEHLTRLVKWADALIDNQPPAVLDSAGLGWGTLQELNPGLVYTSITPYGRTGPRSSAAGDELTLMHAGGLGNLLPTRSPDISRAPVKLGGHLVGYHGGLVAALATLGALFGRRKTGRGELIDVSLQEVVLSLVGPTLAANRYHGTTWSRVPDRPPGMGRMQTKDGYVILNAFDDHHFRALRELMGDPKWLQGEDWESMAYRIHHLMDVAPQIEEWMLQQEKHHLHHLAARKGIPIGPINDARDVMSSPQYEARNYFVEVNHPRAGRHRYAGWPYQMTATPARVHRSAPLLDEHRQQIMALPSESSAGATPDRAAEESLPLDGVRVMEFCWVWAGPFAGRLLASLGAEVIKVEGHRRSDLTRRSIVWPLAEAAPSQVPPNQGLAFNAVNLNKKSLSLDLGTPEGVELARRLAAHCDVALDNMRPGALEKRGLGYQDLVKVRPDIIVASSSSRGRTGPERDYLGFAMIHQGVGGGAYVSGYPDGAPCHSLGDVDLMNAMGLAYATVAALHHRRRTGEGQFIDYSQCEGVSSILGEVLLGYEITGQSPERVGNAHPLWAPHNVYRAWGVDRWLALEIHSDEEFTNLTQLMGRPELAADARFRDTASRKKNEGELDGIIEDWTAKRDRDWMVEELTAAGLAVAPSRDGRDLYADPHLKARGAFIKVDHPEIGELELTATPWQMSCCQAPTQRAPLLGEHNDYVLRELLGLEAQEVDELRDKDVIL